MAAKKITEYTADASPTVDDLLLVVNDPGGSPANRKVTLEALRALILGIPPQPSVLTGTQNAFAATSQVVRLNNATLLIINGIAAGYDGQEITFYSVGAGDVHFNHSSGSASAGDKLSLWVTVGITPLAAGTGGLTVRYDGTLGVWRLISHTQGNFINIPYASCVFDANSGAHWTVDSGDLIGLRYHIQGRAMLIQTSISGTTTLTGVGTRLRVDFSAYSPWVWPFTTRNWARVVDTGAAQNGMITCAAGTTALLQFSQSAADTAWGVGVDNRTIDAATVLIALT